MAQSQVPKKCTYEPNENETTLYFSKNKISKVLWGFTMESFGISSKQVKKQDSVKSQFVCTRSGAATAVLLDFAV